MQIFRAIRRLVRAVVPPAVFLGLALYFGYNALQGDHGIKAYKQQLKLLDQAVQAKKDADDEQIVWKRRIGSLNERALDADMLDERSRAMLNLARNGDTVIPYGPHDKLY